MKQRPRIYYTASQKALPRRGKQRISLSSVPACPRHHLGGFDRPINSGGVGIMWSISCCIATTSWL